MLLDATFGFFEKKGHERFLAIFGGKKSRILKKIFSGFKKSFPGFNFWDSEKKKTKNFISGHPVGGVVV